MAERYRQMLAGFMQFNDNDIPALRQLVTAVTGGVVRLSVDAGGFISAEVRGHWRALWMTPVDPENGYLANWPGRDLPNKMAGKKRMVAGTGNRLVLHPANVFGRPDARTAELVRQVKVVAGARNHLNLLFDAPHLGR